MITKNDAVKNELSQASVHLSEYVKNLEIAITALQKSGNEPNINATPSSRWSELGQQDPHGSDYDCERSKLILGELTDDELANAVFMHGNERPDFNAVMNGSAKMPIVYLTAAKERIRWLSRALNKNLCAPKIADSEIKIPKDLPNIWNNCEGNIDSFAYEILLAAGHFPQSQNFDSDLEAHTYPMQPVIKDEHGIIRFEANKIIDHLCRCGKLDMNYVAIWCGNNNIETKYQEQLAQLVGYSLCGYNDLSYVSDKSIHLATNQAKNIEVTL